MSISTVDQRQVKLVYFILKKFIFHFLYDFIRANHVCKPASVLYKKGKHHFGSIYCVAWNTEGDLIATGSNDKTIKLVKFTPDLSDHPGNFEFSFNF